MRLMGKLFGGVRNGGPTQIEPRFGPVPLPLSGPLNPKLAGNFLVHQLLLSPDSKFGLPEAEMVSFGESLPDTIREQFPVWASFYLAWLMRGIAGATYGREFQIEMIAHAFARLENSRDVVPDMDVPIDMMRNFFARLDDALAFYDKPSPTGIDLASLPVHIPIAMSLLLWSEGTPYFKGAREFDGVENELAMALAKLDERARPLLILSLKNTAESTTVF